MRQTFDRRSILGYCAGGGAMAALLSFASPSYAKTMQFKADLKGSDEVPPNSTTGTGSLTATFDTDTKALTWKGTFSGLTGAVTAAHFHGPAEPGKNAGVAVFIKPKDQKDPLASPFEGSATLTDAQVAELMDGRWYANLHTAANPGGELRGQVVKA
jgi:hypothetical protein